MAESTGVTSIPPRGLTVEVLATGVLFSISAGSAGVSASSSQRPPSVLLTLGWPLFAVVGGVLLDRTPGLRLGRTLAALSLAPAAIVAWSVVRTGGFESADLASTTADLAAPLGCALAVAVPAAFGAAPRRRADALMVAGYVLAAAGSVLVVAARVAAWPGVVQGTGWTLAAAGTLTTWALVARSVRRTDRSSRRRLTWLLVTLATGGAVVAATWTLWPGQPGFYATCGALMIGSLVIGGLWVTADFRPLDEHLLDVGLALGVLVISAVTTGLVFLGSQLAHRTSNTTTVVFTALLTAAMTAPGALWVRRNTLATRYGSGLIPPEDVAAITADLHAKTEPRDLLDKAARMVAAASGSKEVRIVLGDDDPSAPERWAVHPLEVGGDRVGSLLIESPDPEGPEIRQVQVVAQLLPTVALVARAVGLAVEAEHARRDVARERDAERKRVMGDLHDGLGPVLAGMSMRVQAALRTPGTADTETLLADLAADLAASRTDLRRIVSGITPSVLDDGDLEAALHSLVRSFGEPVDGPRVRLHVSAGAAASPAVEVAVYRCVAEGVTNALRHAAASSIDVRVQADTARIRVDVVDDGRGGPVVPGVGLSSLALRARSLGGCLSVDAGDSGGTHLHVELPTSAEAGVLP
ncbi:sensor histidine kinase [Marmoricola sp. URHA0025 HA25]